MRKSIFNGKIYYIPEEKIEELKEFIEKGWKPVLDAGLTTETGVKRIPTNIKALSFTLFLKEWYDSKFTEYIVPDWWDWFCVVFSKIFRYPK